MRSTIGLRGSLHAFDTHNSSQHASGRKALSGHMPADSGDHARSMLVVPSKRLCLLVISCPSLPPSLPGSRMGRARFKVVSGSYDAYSPSNVQPRQCKTTGKSSPGTSIPSLVQDHLPKSPVTKDKCSRALSVSSAGGSRKNPRLKQPSLMLDRLPSCLYLFIWTHSYIWT